MLPAESCPGKEEQKFRAYRRRELLWWRASCKSIRRRRGGGGLAPCLTVVWLQSVGMCRRVAGVAGAALEAVVVLLFLLLLQLLAVTDAVHAVGLHRGELHALDVHLCTKTESILETKKNKAPHLDLSLIHQYGGGWHVQFAWKNLKLHRDSLALQATGELTDCPVHYRPFLPVHTPHPPIKAVHVLIALSNMRPLPMKSMWKGS